MKIIIAGMPKTGTKSLAAALRELGFVCYDFTENFTYLEKEWTKIMIRGVEDGDFKRMYENVDVTLDVPACTYWEEILKEFPDAKIIFMQRDSADQWFESMHAQLMEINVWQMKLLKLLSPTARRVEDYSLLLSASSFGCKAFPSLFRLPIRHKTRYVMAYNQHNTYLLQNAPKDQLLEYSVKSGWAPLCKFLNKEIPSKPFPHVNARGTKAFDLLKNEPTFQKVLMETLFFASVYVFIFAFVFYKIYSLPKEFVSLVSFSFNSLKTVLSMFFSFFFK